MPALTASQEMKEVAIADEPKKETTYYGHTYTTRTYFAFMNCLVQDGVLKAAFFLPDHLRLDGNNPAYEVFIDKENRQFLTYDHLEKKWRDAKLDRLEWPGRNYYATCWVSEEDAALVQDYFSGERGGDLGILDFQRNVRDEQLERRHKRITDPWDKDLAQVPKLPKAVTAPSAGRRCPFPGIPTTTKRDAVSAAAILWCSRLWGAQAIFKQISIMLIWSSGAGMDLSFGNSGRTEPTERIPCRTASPIGMSSGVRFMTAPAKSVPITGGCTASGKHAGSREAPAITLIMVINPAG